MSNKTRHFCLSSEVERVDENQLKKAKSLHDKLLPRKESGVSVHHFADRRATHTSAYVRRTQLVAVGRRTSAPRQKTGPGTALRNSRALGISRGLGVSRRAMRRRKVRSASSAAGKGISPRIVGPRSAELDASLQVTAWPGAVASRHGSLLRAFVCQDNWAMTVKMLATVLR